MNRCRTCVYPVTKPDLHFDETGECSACRSYRERPKIDWAARKEELMNLLDRHDGKVIVPSSGGKDSTYQAITLKELGADVTAVTATTCHLTEIGRKNIDNLSRYVRTIEVSPNKTVRAKLNRFGLELVGDISWPEHASIFSTPFRMAVALKTPLIMYGENPQNQYGGPPGTAEAVTMTRRWTQEFGGFLGLRPSDFIGMEGITSKDMADYELPKQSDMDCLSVEAHFLGQYIPWDSHRNADIAQKYGMIQISPSKANWWEFENQDNLDTFWHDHAMYRKFGYGRFVSQICVDIRKGLVTRNEAIELARLRDGLVDPTYAGLSIYDSADRIGLSESDMWKIMDNFTEWGLFSHVEDHRPILRDQSEAY